MAPDDDLAGLRIEALQAGGGGGDSQSVAVAGDRQDGAGAEEHLAGRGAQPLQGARRAVEAKKSGAGADPQLPRAVLEERVDLAARRAAGLRRILTDLGEGSALAIEAVEAAVGGGPEHAVAVHQQPTDEVVAQAAAGGIVAPVLEALPGTIEAIDTAVEGADPQVPVAILGDRQDQVVASEPGSAGSWR